jgi:hypothetical protein
MRAGCLSDADALVFWRNVVMPDSYLGARDQAQVMKELERDVSLWDYVQCAPFGQKETATSGNRPSASS